MEEVLRVLKSERGLAACQAGYRRPGSKEPRPLPQVQEHHIALCLVGYLIVEHERLAHGRTWRTYKRRLILQGIQVALPALERVRKAA